MNEKRIQEVIEVEKDAEDMLDAARKEAERLPIEAEEEAGKLVEDARAAAEQEARRLVDEAESDVEVKEILAAAEEKGKRLESKSKGNFDRAVGFVLDRVIGRASS
jgi:vacuolar-type H+-ATPase subunit H